VWNDRRLVRRAARGDSDAFAAIFRRYQQDLYRYCVAILGDEQDAQDALQNTMVKALGALPGERRQIELKPWLYRVAHNESIELRRRARPTAPPAADLAEPSAGPEERAAERRRLRDLLADIAELPERHRGALVMRELAGLDFEEIAAALDTSPGAARQVLYEARRSLRQMSDGREMKCDEVTALLSDQDGRVRRRRDVRAHLRDCPGCRRFAEQIRSRSETLAGIAPLSAIAAAAIAKGALGGAAGGGASTVGAGATAGGSASGASTGGAGLAAGTAAKVASTGAIVKSAAAIVAVVGVSAVAVDQGHLFAKDRSVDDGSRPAVTVAGRESAASGSHDTARTGEIQTGARAGSRSPRAHLRGRAVTAIGTKARKAGAARSVSDPSSGGGAAPSPAPTGARSHAGDSQSQTHPRHPAHPPHPAHPVHPAHLSHPAHPAHPVHPPHPVRPAQTEAGGGPSKSTPSPSPKAQKPTRSAVPVKAPPEHPEHQSPPATEASSTPTEAAPEAEGAAAAAAPVEAEAAPVQAAPGLEGKETGR
jgi:RNA polymerase sigma factor (sigma-70 family)